MDYSFSFSSLRHEKSGNQTALQYDERNERKHLPMTRLPNIAYFTLTVLASSGLALAQDPQSPPPDPQSTVQPASPQQNNSGRWRRVDEPSQADPAATPQADPSSNAPIQAPQPGPPPSPRV